MATTSGNKPRKNVEAGLYAGRKSFSGPDGLPKGESKGADNYPQFENDQCLKRNQGDVPDDRRPSENSRHGLNPAFDSDEPRVHAKSLGGGGNAEKSPFSAAGKNFK